MKEWAWQSRSRFENKDDEFYVFGKITGSDKGINLRDQYFIHIYVYIYIFNGEQDGM